MAVEGDIIRIRDQQTYLTTEMENVYYYRIDVVGTDPLGQRILTLFENEIWPDVVDLQSDAVTHERLDWVNISNQTEFGVEVPAVPVVGTVTGEGQANFYAFGIKLLRETRVTRNGAKRIGGIPESLVSGNNPTASALGNLTTLAFALSVPHVIAGWTFTPVIYGAATGPPSNLPVRVNKVRGAEVVGVTTQNSRKR